jgi:hypothetical protein
MSHNTRSAGEVRDHQGRAAARLRALAASATTPKLRARLLRRQNERNASSRLLRLPSGSGYAATGGIDPDSPPNRHHGLPPPIALPAPEPPISQPSPPPSLRNWR